MTHKKNKSTLYSVYFTFFVDFLSWAVVFPIFAPYFLDTQNHVFSPDVSQGTRSMILGFFIMAFSLGQFLASPIIGEYADKHGRKKALVLSSLFTFFGLILTAYSMQINNLYWLFLGRLVTGVFASNTSVCLSSASDLSESEGEKVKIYGTLSMIAGLAFIIGAFAGGKLSDRTLSQDFFPTLPLWIAAGFTFFNLLFLMVGFKETAEIHPHVKFKFFESFQNIAYALKTSRVKRIYTVYFLFLFGWTILFQFIPVLTVQKFSYTNSNIGDLALFMGICWAIGSGYLNQFLISRFNSMLILEICLIGFTFFCAALIYASHIYAVIAFVGLCVIFGSIGWPICTGLISSRAPQTMQGKILGLSQSVQSFAMTIGPLVGGIAFQSSLYLPFLIASGTCLIAVVVYYFVLKGK